MFINENQPYRMRESLAKKCSLYMLEISREYLISQDEKLAQKYIEPVANAEAFSYCCFVPSEEDDTDEDILLQAVLAAAQTAQGRDLAYELDMKSWIFTAWGSLYKKFVQIEPACKNAILRERAEIKPYDRISSGKLWSEAYSCTNGRRLPGKHRGFLPLFQETYGYDTI